MQDIDAAKIVEGTKVTVRTSGRLGRWTVEAMGPVRAGIFRAKDGDDYVICRVEDVIRLHRSGQVSTPRPAVRLTARIGSAQRLTDEAGHLLHL
jgi:hypothetical protein